MEPGPDGAREARRSDGGAVDLFEFVDYLSETFQRLYVVDLDGLDRNRPQLDYLQEITKDTDVWVDGGVSDADGVIDIVVAGARKAVVSTIRFDGPEELERALGLTPELVVETELDAGGHVLGRSGWGTEIDPLAARVRGMGISDLILSPPEPGPDWQVVARLSHGGPVWIGGAFEPEWSARLTASGATGGFFPSFREIIRFESRAPPR
jgi:hypothetical protein